MNISEDLSLISSWILLFTSLSSFFFISHSSFSEFISISSSRILSFISLNSFSFSFSTFSSFSSFLISFSSSILFSSLISSLLLEVDSFKFSIALSLILGSLVIFGEFEASFAKRFAFCDFLNFVNVILTTLSHFLDFGVILLLFFLKVPIMSILDSLISFSSLFNICSENPKE